MPTIKFHADVTFIVGENGSGKSTFIESLAQYLGISRAGGSNQSQVEERPDLSLSDHFKGTKGFRRPSDYFFLRAESLFNVATYLDEAYSDREKLAENYGVNSLHECSHGESFLAIMANRLGGNGLYLFDEPEAADSPILLAYPNAKIYQFDEIGISEVSYEDTEQFRVTKSFLNNYKSMIHNLLRK